MIIYQNHRLLIAVVAIVILVIGIYVGTFLATNLENADFEAVKIGLSFTTIVILLIIVSLSLENQAILQSRKGLK